MKYANPPRHVIESAEQRWASHLVREAVVWREKNRKLRSMGTAVRDDPRAILVELRSRSSFAFV